MKHNLKITFILIGLFLLTQLIGLNIISHYVDIERTTEKIQTTENGKIVEREVTVINENWESLPYNIERPQIQEENSYVMIIISLVIATLFALLLIRLEAKTLWKLWFFLSVWFTLSVAFNAYSTQGFAAILGLILAGLKVLKDNMIIHNFTELFIYGGLAVIFVPVLNLTSIFILLVLISLYDMYAVWKSKHMIKLAKFQTKMKLFAGLLIPYGKNKTAILGGGDLGFPLLFTGVVYRANGLEALLIILGSTIAISLLLLKGEKNKYYPAMPFISIGCLFGYLLTLLV